jgi:sterol desaturase/sphingolipid hydroxylase (fatty acid hydroxylase superfamily)
MTSVPRFLMRVGLPLLGAAFVALSIAERAWPLRARRPRERGAHRLARNAALAASSGAATGLIVYPVLFAVADHASAKGVGLLALLPRATPPLARAALAFVALDYSMYLWHRANHRVPLLWRFHRVHHADGVLDASTAFRFHVGEIALSILYRAPVILLIGVAPKALAWFEIALELMTEMQHANVRVPARVERVVNAVLVTPRMHGVHHSRVARETESNWSVIFSLWDRVHRTMQPRASDVTIGLPGHPEAAEDTIAELFAMPFRSQP